MKYHFKYQKDNRGGYWAECVELKGCLTEADNLAELKENMADVLNLFLSEPSSSKVIFPGPKKSVAGRNIIQVEVSPKVAFANLLRMHRIKEKMSQRQIAHKLGKSLSAYQKLESPRTANPTLSTLEILKKNLPGLKLDKVL